MVRVVPCMRGDDRFQDFSLDWILKFLMFTSSPGKTVRVFRDDWWDQGFHERGGAKSQRRRNCTVQFLLAQNP